MSDLIEEMRKKLTREDFVKVGTYVVSSAYDEQDNFKGTYLDSFAASFDQELDMIQDDIKDQGYAGASKNWLISVDGLRIIEQLKIY